MTRCESKHVAHTVIDIFQELYKILLCLTVVILSFITIFGRLFLDQQRNYELLTKNYVQWSEF